MNQGKFGQYYQTYPYSFPVWLNQRQLAQPKSDSLGSVATKKQEVTLIQLGTLIYKLEDMIGLHAWGKDESPRGGGGAGVSDDGGASGGASGGEDGLGQGREEGYHSEGADEGEAGAAHGDDEIWRKQYL